jgi:hypothetical protein
MALKPRVNAFLMKSMSAVTDNAHHLTHFNRVLADGTIIVLLLIGAAQNGMAVNLFRSGADNDGLIQKGLETSC